MPAAIITGGDSGIGRAAAVILAERGWDVGITYRSDEQGARETAEEIEGHGRRAEVRRIDLTDLHRVGPLVEELADALGGLDLFVNNAGTGSSSPFLEMELEELTEVLDTDFVACFVAGQAAARVMVRGGRGGRIVNVTSVHEHVPLRGSTAYVAAKHALGGLTKSMALELAEHGIAVNSVAPGEIATPMTGQHHTDPHDEDRKWSPAGRPGHAREIGEWIAFLATPATGFATGASFVVDGGLTLMAAVPNQLDP